MRLTTVILIATLMQVSASGFSQKNVTYVKKKTNLWDLFVAIKAQTGYKVLWSDEVIKISEAIEANFKNASIEEVMEKVLIGKPLTYVVQDEMIVIRREEPSFRESVVRNTAPIDVSGRVLDERNLPLVGATVKVKGSSRTVLTNNKGEFILKNVDDKAVLVISFLGFETIEIKAADASNSIKLLAGSDKLDEVQIVSTGYQNVQKDRATGSFTVVDNKLLNRAVGPDLLSRLKGVTNGLLIDPLVGNPTGISVRGRSTIFSNTKPLIVIDNFPYEGDLNSINPNDIENVTVLKDASAASIWGVRAGNGVIVITTKKGRFNKKPEVTLNSNITLTDKPNLYYEPQLSSAEWIDIEKFLFSEGKYTAALRDNWSFITPVIELLAKKTPENAASIDAQIEALKQYDIRDQKDKYFYRRGMQQQYFLNLNGGGTNNSYNYSIGYDRNDPIDVGKSSRRYTARGANTYGFFNNRLQVTTEFVLNRSTSLNDFGNGFYAYTPYEQIATPDGIPLPVSDGVLRASYTDVAGKGRLLDWKYRPLDELRLKASTYNSESTEIRFNTGARYKILTPLSISANYQYFKSTGVNKMMGDLNSFRVRNEINKYTQINEATGEIKYPFPMGNIYTESHNFMNTNYGRIQLDFQKQFLTKHSISAIIGYEIRSENRESSSIGLYGYDPETKTSIVRDNQTTFPYFYNSSSNRFNSNPISQDGTINNYISYYSNLTYSYNDRYILSGSFRKDRSNLFGVNGNQKGVPLWSTGVAWNIDNEPFYRLDFLQQLQVKGSFGYNGNVNNSITAFTTALTYSPNLYNAPYLEIINPPNPSLRWERVQNINLGLFFDLKRSVLSGSIEFYIKKGKDLIGTSPIAPQSGVQTYTGNAANTKTRGMDLQLNSRNLDKLFKWHSNFILNFSKDKITTYMLNKGTNTDVVNNTVFMNPILGYPINSIFSYKSAGLDQLGNPQGYLNSEISTDYIKIGEVNNISELVFHGSRVPTFFGGFRNTFTYKSIELSINVIYKMGYSFRRNSIYYSALFAGSYKQPEYGQRWQNPGDEGFTDVPSLVYPANSRRDEFYNNSEATVEKGDHIRLNDIKMSYSMPNRVIKKIGFRSLELYAYASNLGIIWVANKKDLDPDVMAGFPMPKNISLGVNANF
ncbi:SusC/RagA family TonB-linked outer membrane protein [Pedobacter sp. N36a]|uniref:SusC/RagA family TonB-linked outer membrane protein n=1 Tax=Pedobacter sp. N36a TaxID=2767996 RepID=UPI001656E05A|nr:SusC/RagA family TonB-linked outer membrane protein [Pedobacter sp. N36a]MBC8986513.1 SusC/RagA family TonB-linked outer membrane protein [Pedobacter sp. N36a]